LAQWYHAGPNVTENGGAELTYSPVIHYMHLLRVDYPYNLKEEGLNRVSGAINCILTHPTDERIIYIGSVNGGVWKTVNANARNNEIHWTPLTDQFPVLSFHYYPKCDI
jgi:hypothetical protein